jgi:hypothetical protein
MVLDDRQISYEEWLETRYFLAIAFQLALAYAIKMFHANQDSLKLNGSHHLLVYADEVNILILGESKCALHKTTRGLLAARKKTDV